MTSLAARISEARKASGLLQEDLADRIGVTRITVSRWEHGKGHPDLAQRIAIAHVTGSDLDWLETGGGTAPAGPGPGTSPPAAPRWWGPKGRGHASFKQRLIQVMGFIDAAVPTEEDRRYWREDVAEKGFIPNWGEVLVLARRMKVSPAWLAFGQGSPTDPHGSEKFLAQIEASAAVNHPPAGGSGPFSRRPGTTTKQLVAALVLDELERMTDEEGARFGLEIRRLLKDGTFRRPG